MQKFKNQRQGFIDKKSGTTTPSLQSSRSMVDSSQTQEEETEIECSLCKDTLSLEHFYSNPYGQFGYVSTSKLLYHAYRQTLELDKAPTQVKEESKIGGAGEIKPATPTDPMSLLGDISCLDYVHGTGATFTKCSHYSHFSCLTNYLTLNESDQQKRNMRKIIGFDFDTF